MILMPQIFDVIANENARYKRNELELFFTCPYIRETNFLNIFTCEYIFSICPLLSL